MVASGYTIARGGLGNPGIGYSGATRCFGVQGLGFRVECSGFRDEGLGFRVWGLGFRV
jgi:hypothetical protein